MASTFGCSTSATARASCLKRSSLHGSTRPAMSLIATRRPRSRSRAAHTRPLAPRPSSCSMTKRPANTSCTSYGRASSSGRFEICSITDSVTLWTDLRPVGRVFRHAVAAIGLDIGAPPLAPDPLWHVRLEDLEAAVLITSRLVRGTSVGGRLERRFNEDNYGVGQCHTEGLRIRWQRGEVYLRQGP